MRYSVLIALTMASLQAYATPVPQGVTALLKPTATAPSGFADTLPTSFGITAVKLSDMEAQCASEASDGQATVNQSGDGQTTTGGTSAANQLADGQATAGSGTCKPNMVACGGSGVLTVTLNNGVLLDDKGRTGYIAANYQFQFDRPAQTGAIYTGGYSVGANGSLALGGSAVFYSCTSGGFANLYDRSWAAQCYPVLFQKVTLMDCPSK